MYVSSARQTVGLASFAGCQGIQDAKCGGGGVASTRSTRAGARASVATMRLSYRATEES